MKNTFVKSFMSACLTAFMVLVATSSHAQLTKKEVAYAVKLLTETQQDVPDAVKGLSSAQLAFRTAPEKWSAEDCVKHIASAETVLWSMVKEALEKEADPAARAAIKTTDEELVKAVEDRTNKSKTFAALEPANSSYKNVEEALAALRENREKLIRFVQTTKADLRNHVVKLPGGTFDAYQFILLIAAHSNRHTQQIMEVKSAAGFPGN